MGDSNNCIDFSEKSDVVNLSSIVDEENVIEGSKVILTQIRQHWQIENVKFKVSK